MSDSFKAAAGAKKFAGKTASAANWSSRALGRRTFLAGTLGTVLTNSAAAQLSNSLLGSDGLSFLIVGDWGRDGKTFQKDVAGQMACAAKQTNARFTISTGDNFYKLGVSSPYDGQWRRSFEEIYHDPSLQGPWFPVLGNHDYGGNVEGQLRRTATASRWQMRAKWFELTERDHHQPDLHIFLIDTVLWLGKESFPYAWLGSPIDRDEVAEQRQWLAEALGRSKARHKLVVGHHPIYSVGPHGGHPVKPAMAELDTLLRKHDVTAYVCGHDHCLYSIEHAGMHYICSGGGSEELHKFSGDAGTYGCALPNYCLSGMPRWTNYVDRAGFAVFRMTKDDLKFQFVDRTGAATASTSLRHKGFSLSQSPA